jgi:hypothetical protein
MNSGKGSIVLFTIIAVATLLVSVVGATFAYFGATMKGRESQKTISVSSGTLAIEYGTNSKINATNLQPGAVVATKTFTVKGVITGSENLKYGANLVITNNTYSNGALVYTITSKNVSNNGSTIEATSKPVAIPTGASTIELGTGSFAGPTSTGSVHEYTVTITFVNTGADQSADLGKTIAGTLEVAQTAK